MVLPPTFRARLVGTRMLSPSVRELRFERTDGAAFTYQAGQWVNLVLPLESGEVKRAYSIASAPDGTPGFDIAVTRVAGGPGSTYLHGLVGGAEISAVGPQGFFTRTKTTPTLFVATGTGITPLRSMLRAAVAAGETSPLWLLFGVRHEHDRLYADELTELAQKHPNVRFETTLSQPGDAWTGRRGYVQHHVKELWSALDGVGAGAPHAYVCGLQRMVGSVRELLRKDMGLPREQVHTERYD